MRTLLLTLPFVMACTRDETKPVPAGGASTVAPTVAASVETKTAAGTLRGSWQVDGFEAAAPSPSTISSADRLEKEKQDAHVQLIRIVYTGDQVKIYEPGQMLLSSTYEVKESHPTWCRLLSGKDEVLITFADDDHMTIDRKGNAFGSKMKMKRAKDGPGTGKPLVVPSGSASAPPPSGSAVKKP